MNYSDYHGWNKVELVDIISEEILEQLTSASRIESYGHPGLANPGAKHQRDNILYGIGTVALLALLLPPFRHRMLTVFERTAFEGIDLISKARSTIMRAREDMEDLIAEASFNELLKRQKP